MTICHMAYSWTPPTSLHAACRLGICSLAESQISPAADSGRVCKPREHVIAVYTAPGSLLKITEDEEVQEVDTLRQV